MAYFGRVLILMMSIWVAQAREHRHHGLCTNSTKISSDLLKGLNFGGVLTVLALDFTVFLFMMLVFSCMQRFGDHGRLALVSDAESVVYTTSLNVPQQYQQPQHITKIPSSVKRNRKRPGYCSWLTAMYCISDEQIREKCGEDAEHYLSFQHHIIQLLIVICALSIIIVLPINFSGYIFEQHNPYNFGRTMIANLYANNPRLWLHTIFALLYVLLTLYFMRKHQSKVHYREDEVVRHTLFITGIPKDAKEKDIRKHFEEAYEENGCTVEQVTLCYDVAKLMSLQSERKKAVRSKNFYIHLKEKKNRPTMINPPVRGSLKTKFWGHLCSIFKWGGKEEAVSYYTKLKIKLDEEFLKEKEEATNKPIGMAFVTFQNEAMTNHIMRDFNAVKCCGGYCRCCCRMPKVSRFSHKLNLHRTNVSVRYAPDPQNLYWQNLSCNTYWWWLRFVIINVSLFLLLYYLTTPARFISEMDDLKVIEDPILKMFLPTILMAVLSCTLPIVVLYSSDMEAHWTQSVTRREAMCKGYSFLILMVLVLPSLGLSNLEVLFHWLFSETLAEELDRFECVFLPHIGAFFVNYVIASAFIGIPCELLNIFGFVTYMIRLCLARSDADRRHVKKHQAGEFDYGSAYAWMMCVFTIVMAYSIACPIIVPFGLIYMLLKRFTDRYNMYYAYLPTKLDKKIHASAVSAVGMAPLICVFYVFFFTLPMGFKSPPFIFTTTVLIIIFLIFIVWMFFGHSKCLQRQVDSEGRLWEDLDTSNSDKFMYIPPILREQNPDEETRGIQLLVASHS